MHHAQLKQPMADMQETTNKFGFIALNYRVQLLHHDHKIDEQSRHHLRTKEQSLFIPQNVKLETYRDHNIIKIWAITVVH